MKPEIQSLLDDLLPRLDAMKAGALQEIDAAQQVATDKIARHAAAQEELAYTEAEIARVRDERESLPNKAYRAGMDEEFQLEDQLKERYKNLKPALESLEERRYSLRQELHALSPNGDEHPNSITEHHFGNVARVAYGPRTELEALKKKLTEALDASIDPVVQRHETLRATVEDLGRVRSWDRSPVGRGAIR